MSEQTMPPLKQLELALEISEVSQEQVGLVTLRGSGARKHLIVRIEGMDKDIKNFKGGRMYLSLTAPDPAIDYYLETE